MVSLPVVMKSGSLNLLEPFGPLIGFYRDCCTFFIRFSFCLKYTHEAEELSYYSDWLQVGGLGFRSQQGLLSIVCQGLFTHLQAVAT